MYYFFQQRASALANYITPYMICILLLMITCYSNIIYNNLKGFSCLGKIVGQIFTERKRILFSYAFSLQNGKASPNTKLFKKVAPAFIPWEQAPPRLFATALLFFLDLLFFH